MKCVGEFISGNLEHSIWLLLLFLECLGINYKETWNSFILQYSTLYNITILLYYIFMYSLKLKKNNEEEIREVIEFNYTFALFRMSLIWECIKNIANVIQFHYCYALLCTKFGLWYMEKLNVELMFRSLKTWEKNLIQYKKKRTDNKLSKNNYKCSCFKV